MDFNKITLEELSSIIRVKDLRTILSKNGFPKPLFNEDEILFDKQQVADYFNLDNLDEPFMVLKEACEFLGLSESYLSHLTYKGDVPSYRLKSSKGSGYLYRKSELEIFNETKIEGDEHFVNYFMANSILKKLFMTFIKEHFKNDSTTQEYEIVCSYLLDRKRFQEIANDKDISKERIRQIFHKAIFRIESKISDITNKNYVELQRQLIHKDNEIKWLKDKIKSLDKDNYGSYHDHEIDNLSDMYIKLLNLDLIHEDLSVRALNCLKDIVDTTYDLMTKFNIYTKDLNNLSKMRNLGSKSFHEIYEFMKERAVLLEESTGICSTDFLLNTPRNETHALVFLKVHTKMKLIKQKN